MTSIINPATALPGAVFLHTLSFLDERALTACSTVSKGWNASSGNNRLWKEIWERHHNMAPPKGLDIKNYYRDHVVYSLNAVMEKMQLLVPNAELEQCIQVRLISPSRQNEALAKLSVRYSEVHFIGSGLWRGELDTKPKTTLEKEMLYLGAPFDNTEPKKSFKQEDSIEMTRTLRQNGVTSVQRCTIKLEGFGPDHCVNPLGEACTKQLIQLQGQDAFRKQSCFRKILSHLKMCQSHSVQIAGVHFRRAV